MVAGREPDICEQCTPNAKSGGTPAESLDRAPGTELRKRKTARIRKPTFRSTAPRLQGRMLPPQACDSHDIGMAANQFGFRGFSNWARLGELRAGNRWWADEGDIANDAQVIRE